VFSAVLRNNPHRGCRMSTVALLCVLVVLSSVSTSTSSQGPCQATPRRPRRAAAWLIDKKGEDQLWKQL